MNMQRILTNSESSLTDGQEKLLALLPIPTALLSIFGSVTIICMAYKTRRFKKWSTYTRLLVSMSCLDILFTVVFASSAFLLPQDTSLRVWAFGNDQTCSAIGALLQFSYAGVMYSGMLSYYFLLAAKYGWKKRTISRYVEPIMHFISLGYPFATSVAGLVLGVYHETELGQSCWVANYPESCGQGPDESGEPCQSTMLGYIFGATMVAFTLMSLICNNVAILVFVRKQVPVEWRRPWNSPIRIGTSNNAGLFHRSNRKFLEDLVVAKSTQYPERDDDSSSRHTGSNHKRMQQHPIDVEAPKLQSSTTMRTSFATPATISLGERLGSSGALSGESMPDLMEGEDNNHIELRREQYERLQLVATQSYLYVGAFLIPVVWTVILRIMEGLHYSAEQEDSLFILLVLQQVLLPLQGFLNLLVFARPKYLKSRKEFPDQSRLFAFRRAIYGDDVKPNQKAVQPLKSQENENNNSENTSTAGRIGRAFATALIATKTPANSNEPSGSMQTKSNQAFGQDLHSKVGDSSNKVGSSVSMGVATGGAKTDLSVSTRSSKQDMTLTSFLPRMFVSSLTASQDDFSIAEGKDVEMERGLCLPPTRKKSAKKSSPQWTAIRLTSGLISSLTASRGDLSEPPNSEEENRDPSDNDKTFLPFEQTLAGGDTVNKTVLQKATDQSSPNQEIAWCTPSSGKGGDSRRRQTICYSDLTEPLESVVENPYEDEADECSLSSSSRKMTRFQEDHVESAAVKPPRRRSSRNFSIDAEDMMTMMMIMDPSDNDPSSTPFADLEFDRMRVSNPTKNTSQTQSSSLDAPLNMPARIASTSELPEISTVLIDGDDDEHNAGPNNPTKRDVPSAADFDRMMDSSNRSKSSVDTPLNIPARVASSFEPPETSFVDISEDGSGEVSCGLNDGDRMDFSGHSKTTNRTLSSSNDTPLSMPLRNSSSYEILEPQMASMDGHDEQMNGMCPSVGDDRMNGTNHTKVSRGSKSSSVDAPLSMPLRAPSSHETLEESFSSMESYNTSHSNDSVSSDNDFRMEGTKHNGIRRCSMSSSVPSADHPFMNLAKGADSSEYKTCSTSPLVENAWSLLRVEAPLTSINTIDQKRRSGMSSPIDAPLTMPARMPSSLEAIETAVASIDLDEESPESPVCNDEAVGLVDFPIRLPTRLPSDSHSMLLET